MVKIILNILKIYLKNIKVKKMKQPKLPKQRDYNILLHIKGEINLSTRRVNSKEKYSRKTKHKKDLC